MNSALGKAVAQRRYIHVSLVPSTEPELAGAIALASSLAGVRPEIDYNVVRIDERDDTVAFLSYPSFFEEGCPLLQRSWKVSIKRRCVTQRSYQDSFNPPVLHRKELLLEESDSRRSSFERLTAELEALGCFEDPIRIGFKLQWERLLGERGFRLVGHQLVPIGNAEPTSEVTPDSATTTEITRHLTALSRQNFSAPIQILLRYGFLDGSRTVFDYGCGKGDDLRGLVANGLQATGWDPYYASMSRITSARVVNLGFVINVIEDPIERAEALQRAYSLADELLVVSTMVATDNPGKVTPYSDGVLTSRATFQKYYTQAELRQYLSVTLDEEPIPVAPGVYFVFKDKVSEQSFLAGRQRGQLRVRPLTRPLRADPDSLPQGRPRVANKYETYEPLLAPLWAQCLDLGREPDPEEVPQLGAIEGAVGSLRKALRIVLAHNNPAELQRARGQRIEDLKVFLALQQFQRRKPYRTLESRLQRDIRAFFGDYSSAQEHAKHLLFQVAQPELLDECCRVASEQGLGHLEPSHSLQLHSSLVERLPSALRVYVGCAGVLYGDICESDIVKIHIRSGKVSFMKYDDFIGRAIPRMRERAKINLRTLNVQLFTYGEEFPCPPLYHKSRYMNEELPNYAKQVEFDDSLRAVNVDLSGYGPSGAELAASLERARLRVDGFRLERQHRVPSLDEPCGRYLTYRQLIECGETQANSTIPNLPKNPESYTALFDLATSILDPVIEYFGSIELTYGFCSSQLARQIHGGIAPELDQHAAHETKRLGGSVCSRLGAAVDFLVTDENMREVAGWIIANLPFDRLYYYGPNRPLHVSYGPDHKREAIEMVLTPNQRRIPRPLQGKSA